MKTLKNARKMIFTVLFSALVLSTMNVFADGFPPPLPPPAGGNPGGGAPVPPIVLPIE